MSLTRSKDRKVTNLVNKTGKTPVIANAFGLPSGKAFSCPGATSVCERVCYAGKLEKVYKGVRNVLENNFNQLIEAASWERMSVLIVDMLNDFHADCVKRNAELKFRIHWDGDFFSEEYAKAWHNAIIQFPDIQFWVYTRSFVPAMNVLPIITGIDNLTVYLSVDNDNMAHAKLARKIFPSVKWAWLAETFADGKKDMPLEGKRYDCPENAKRIPLISEKGSACVRCGICVEGRGDVIFSIKKR